MNKRRIGIFVFILVLLGVFSVSIYLGDFFFTTKYYKTPIEAYNADSTYNPTYGDAAADREIGVVSLDDSNCLFIGELNEDCFVVAEMAVKDGRYAAKGMSVFYDLSEESDGMNGSYQTNIADGYVRWAVMYSQSEVEKLSDVLSVESYMHSNGHIIYLVIYNN